MLTFFWILSNLLLPVAIESKLTILGNDEISVSLKQALEQLNEISGAKGTV